MNRIQQILSKAERDGTARRLEGADAVPSRSTAPPAPYSHATVLEPVHPAGGASDDAVVEPDRLRADRPWHEEPVESVGFTSATPARVAEDARLNPVLVAAISPRSPAAEQYRSLRTRITQSDNGHAMRVIQICSPANNDGKTVTALNLALTMAQEFQRRVLILDADLRQPAVHTLLGLSPGPGLVDVLTGHAPLEEALVEIPEHHLTVLRAGGAYERPAEILGSGPMRRLVDGLRTQFDRIVVDSAPALVADPVAVAPLMDGLLLVVRAGTTTRPSIANAVGALASSKLLGLVFNDAGGPVESRSA